MGDLRFARLSTKRLRLLPLTPEGARAILAGDLTGLSGLEVARGWPHADTATGLTMAVSLGHAPPWLVTVDGLVIGDCGTHGPVDHNGAVEIGYGLAEPWRGLGYGSEAAQAVTEWLLDQPGLRTVRAATSTGNVASRRVLEKAGFRLVGIEGATTAYERTRTDRCPP